MTKIEKNDKKVKNSKNVKKYKNLKKCISKDIYAYFDRFDRKNIKK